jgi:hypothetical protein
LNEAILGHHALQHSTEDLVQFVDSLDLTGDSQIDQALWGHHSRHHSEHLNAQYHVTIPVNSASDAIPLTEGHMTVKTAIATIAKQHVAQSNWEATTYSIMYAAGTGAASLGFSMAWFTKNGSFAGPLSQAHLMSGLSFLAAGLCCWLAMCYYLAFVVGNLSWLFVTFSIMRFHEHNTVSEKEEDKKHKMVALIHALTCAAWLVAGIWESGTIWTFFWVVSMAANVIHATHVANKKATGFGVFKWINYVSLGSMIAYALVFTWYMNADNILL